MISFADNKLSRVMTMDEVRTACPYAFAETPTNPGVSEKYTHANTATVIEDMAKLGWYPVQAKQCRHKKNSSGIRSFHIIAFENKDVYIEKDGQTEAYVRIILQNSHDGFNSFKFMMGLYRMCCSNGCVVADAEFANFSIRHINYDFEELRTVVAQVLDSVPNVVNQMNTMSRTVLTENQKREMAVETYKIRKGIDADEKVTVTDATIDELLTPVREEDKGDTLWNVYNVLQEKLIRGGFIITSLQGKTRKQRPITSIKKDTEYNQQLWAVAAQYMPAMAA